MSYIKFMFKGIAKVILTSLTWVFKALSIIMQILSSIGGVIIGLISSLLGSITTIFLILAILGTFLGGSSDIKLLNLFTLEEHWYIVIIGYLVSGVVLIIPFISGIISTAFSAVATFFEVMARFEKF